MKTTKRILTTLFVALMIVASSPHAGFIDFELPNLGISASAIELSGNCGENLEYYFENETKLLVITGYGYLFNNGKTILTDAENSRNTDYCNSINYNADNIINSANNKILELKRQGYYTGTDAQYNREISSLRSNLINVEAQLAAINTSTAEGKARYAKLKIERDNYQLQIDKLVNAHNNTVSIKFLEDSINTFENNRKKSLEKAQEIHLTNLETINNVEMQYGYNPCSLGNHIFSAIISLQPTCNEDGYKSYICSSCGKVIGGEIISATGHKNVTIPAVEATCSAEGKTAGSKCSICGTVTKKQQVVAKKAHTYKNVVAKATLSKNGKIVPTCSVCGATKTATTIYYPKTVTLKYTETTYTGKALKPTVTVKDSKGNKIASSNYTVSYKSNTNVGKATVTITFKGNYKGTITKSFNINPKATTVSKLTAKSKGFTATWKKQSTQVTGYEIQYSTSSKFTDKTTKKITVKDAKTVSKTISSLKSNTKYYVRIRTYKTVSKTNYYSDWSKALSVVTKK